MRPNTRLIDALFQTADHIEQNPYLHNWGNSTHCNCGILANFLLDDQPVNEDLSPDGAWAGAINEYVRGREVCSTSGLSLNTLIARLLQAGLDIPDFERIEFIEEGSYDTWLSSLEEPWKDPYKVASYLRRKAQELQVQLAIAPSRIQPIDTVPVKVGLS